MNTTALPVHLPPWTPPASVEEAEQRVEAAQFAIGLYENQLADYRERYATLAPPPEQIDWRNTALHEHLMHVRERRLLRRWLRDHGASFEAVMLARVVKYLDGSTEHLGAIMWLAEGSLLRHEGEELIAEIKRRCVLPEVR